MENQFLDIKKWLQEKLDAIKEGFKVSNERQIDGDFEGEVVVSALSGTPYEESANIPYQIDVFTSNIDETMNVLNILCKTVSNVEFEQIIKTGKEAIDGEEVDTFQTHRIKPLLNTPVVLDKDIDVASNHYARIVIFATMLVFYDVNDIKELEIDGEKINMLNGSMSYVAEMMSNRVSNQPLNKSKKKASTVSINFSMVNKASTFTNAVFDTTVGQRSGNDKFVVKVTMNNGKTATLNMIIGNATLGTARGRLPSLNVAMYLYDERGDSNNASS